MARSNWESSRGNARNISDTLEYTASLKMPAMITFGTTFRTKHPKVVKFSEEVASSPGSAWKVSIELANGVGGPAPMPPAKPPATPPAKKRKESQRQIKDMESAFVCVRNLSCLRKVGICHRYFPMPKKQRTS